MASAPAGAQGVRDALDLLLAKGRMPAEEDLRVVVLTGDGAAYGMGLSATSAAIDRGLDFLYLCYDNEGYGNTGQQSSAATPHAARTATDAGRARRPRASRRTCSPSGRRIGPAYVATMIARRARSISRARSRRRRACAVRACCSRSRPARRAGASTRKDAVEIGRLAVRTGVWPLKE